MLIAYYIDLAITLMIINMLININNNNNKKRFYESFLR